MVPAKLLFVVLAVSVFIGAEAIECGRDINTKASCTGKGFACKYSKQSDGKESWGCDEPEKKFINQCVKLPSENVYYCDTGDYCNKADKCTTWKDPKDIAELAPTPAAPKSSGHLVQPTFILSAILFLLF